MDTFDISDEQIIDCIVDCACNMNGENISKTIKILVDFMQFKNSIKDNNIYDKLIKKEK